MRNFYHGGGNGVNAYGGSNHGPRNFISRGHDGYGNFTPKRHNGVRHTSYDNFAGYERVNAKYVEHSPYGCHKGSHYCYDFGDHSYGRGDYNESLIDENVYRRDNQNENIVRTKCKIENVRIFEHEKKEKSLMKAKECDSAQLSNPSQGVAKVGPLTPSIIEEAPKVKELPHAKLEIEESLETHVEKEISNEDSCDNINEKNIEKEECIEVKERKEWKKERDSLRSENFECSKEKDCELEKSESIKENECFIEKQIKNEDQGEIVIKELIQRHENSSMTLFLTLLFYPHEISYEQLKLFLASYIFYVSIIGDACSISFGLGLFLVMPYVSKTLSYHASLEEPLLNSSSMFDNSFHDFGLMNNASIDSIVVDLRLECALLDILHDKCVGKFVENVVYFSSSLILLWKIIMILYF
ncbi:hypothetical protein M9H77_13002 [Catharanthus roseus]|uniref:Uncharacterized protein n=1 Tax=Catharanthus roseus TaxID=4058 RepID=A0ACC0BJ65_CATRO|nr:hypothetical protein M9H77_13002 [Catharanthus roseus]